MAAKLVTVEDLKKLCLTPEGAKYLQTAWEAETQPAPKIATHTVVAVSTQAAPAAPVAVEVSSPAVAVSTPAVAESTRPFAVAWRQPHPGKPTALDLPALKPPFDSLARLMLQVSDPEDAWSVVSALRRAKVFLVLDGTRGEPYGLLVPVSPSQPSAGWIVTVTPGYVESPMLKGRLAVNPQVLAKQLARNGLGGRPVPLAAVNPLDDQRKLLPGRAGEPRRYGYPDGSSRVEFTSGQLAGVLAHELAHLARRLDGGGADKFLDERDAQSMECRFLVRLEQAQADVILDPPLRRLVSACRSKRSLAEADFVEPYLDLAISGKAQAPAAAALNDQRLGRAAAAFHDRWRKRLVTDFLARWRRWMALQQKELEILPPAERDRMRAQIEMRDAQIRENPWAMVFRFDWRNPLGAP